MNSMGIIIGSGIESRIGTRHYGAVAAITKRTMIEILNDNNKLGVLAGVNEPIIVDNDLIGVVGITGPVDEVRSISKLVSATTILLIEKEEYLTVLEKTNKSLEIKIEDRTREVFCKKQELEATLIELKSARAVLVRNTEETVIRHVLRNISHEINTPLGSALTMSSYMTELIVKKLEETIEYTKDERRSKALTSEMFEVSNLIQDNIRKSISVIGYFNQLAMDMRNREQCEFNLFSLTNEILLSNKYLFKNKRIEINVYGDESITIISYPTTYFDILTHLIQFSINDSLKNIESGIISIYFEKSDGHLSIAFNDNGKKIDKDMKQHIDEPFYKNLKGFEQKNYNLSIVRRAVVSTLGGDIEIIDTEDNHTHFNIDIPV